jgi:hypothetical protein
MAGSLTSRLSLKVEDVYRSLPADLGRLGLSVNDTRDHVKSLGRERKK